MIILYQDSNDGYVYVCVLEELGELGELDLSESIIVFQIILCYFQAQLSRN